MDEQTRKIPSTYAERTRLRRLAHDFVCDRSLQPPLTLGELDNARVECSPDHLDRLVRKALLDNVDGRYNDEVIAWR